MSTFQENTSVFIRMKAVVQTVMTATIPSSVLLSPLSELASLEKSLPGKKRRLSEAESELRVVGEAAERLGQQVRACRTQAEEARSALQAHRSRYVGSKVKHYLARQPFCERTPGLSRQCSATEPRQPDNHQPSQSSLFSTHNINLFQNEARCSEQFLYNK